MSKKLKLSSGLSRDRGERRVIQIPLNTEQKDFIVKNDWMLKEACKNMFKKEGYDFVSDKEYKEFLEAMLKKIDLQNVVDKHGSEDVIEEINDVAHYFTSYMVERWRISLTGKISISKEEAKKLGMD